MIQKRVLFVGTTALVIFLMSLSNGAPARSSQPPSAGFRKPPYLIYGGRNTEMTVLWQSTVTAAATISWGLDTSYRGGTTSVGELGPKHFFRYVLTGLIPGRKYHYRVALADRTAAGSFVAAPAKDGPASLFLFSDTRSRPVEFDRVAAAMESVYASDPALQGLALDAGDLVAAPGCERSWDRLFGPRYDHIRRLFSEVPIQVATGNHEGNSRLFTAYFPYPYVRGHYWSFDYGIVHVTVVDQYSAVGLDPGQLRWIASDLAATDCPWKIILLHRPGWSAGHYRNDVNVQRAIQPLAKPYGAIIVAGHNHYYARAVVDGVTHVTTGGGGAPLATPVLPSPNVLIAEKTYHFCLIEAGTRALRFRAIRRDGSTIDTFTLTR